MTLKEINKDLFTVEQGYYLAHSISKDFKLAAGIAKQFDEIYNMEEKLNRIYGSGFAEVGEAILIDNVFNLITKEKAFQRPTYDSIADALDDMKIQMDGLLITKLAIPEIGCGLDKLEWIEVKAIIEDIFGDTDIEILMCSLF